VKTSPRTPGLRQLLAARGIPEYRIAELLGLSKSDISLRMNGKREWRLSELQKIAAFLKVPIGQLLTPIQLRLEES
jgi:transcriptional regulator with XRE-family HTH domain